MIEYYLQNYKEILNVILTFVGTILAIFFTLFALPIQNILGRFSQDTVNKVLWDKINLGLFALLAIIFVYNFTLLLYGPESIWLTLSIISGYSSVIILMILIIRIFRLLDLRNQIKSISKKIAKRLKREKYDGVDALRDDLDYLLDFSQRAIQMDRFELFDSSMTGLVKISKMYVAVYEKKPSYQDPYYLLLSERFTDLKNAIKIENHTKFMDSLVRGFGKIGLEGFELSESNGFNFAVTVIVDNLKDILMSREILKDTSTSPYRAIKEIEFIAGKAVETNCIGTAYYCISELCNSSRFTSKLHIDLGNYVSKRANEAVSRIINNLFNKLTKISHSDSTFLRNSFEEINKTLRAFYSDDYEHSYNTNISPYYYPMATHGFSILLVNIMRKIIESNDKYYQYELLNQVKEFLLGLNQNIILALKNGYYTEVQHILHQIYPFAIMLINFKNTIDVSKDKLDSGEITEDIRLRFKVCDLLKGEVLSIYYNPIYSSLGQGKNKSSMQYWDYLDIYTSIIGVMLCEYRKEGSFSGNDFCIILEWINGIFELIEANKEKIMIEKDGKKWENYDIINPLKDFYYFIKLIGGWDYILNDKTFFKKIKPLINEQPQITKETNVLGFEQDLLGFSGRDFTILDQRGGGKKYLTPPGLVPSYFPDYNKKLFDVELFKKYLEELKSDDKKSEDKNLHK